MATAATSPNSPQPQPGRPRRSKSFEWGNILNKLSRSSSIIRPKELSNASSEISIPQSSEEQSPGVNHKGLLHRLERLLISPNRSRANSVSSSHEASKNVSGSGSVYDLNEESETPPKFLQIQPVTKKTRKKTLTYDILENKYELIRKKTNIGEGATSVVRMASKKHRRDSQGHHPKLYAVKMFRKRVKSESEKEYVKKVTSEFCISSSLHYNHIVQTLDLVQDQNGRWCEIMEYCPGGDLFSLIKEGKMSYGDINCCFKQLMYGVHYLHSVGVAHRDLKPENILFNEQGCLKITDFGVSDVFKTAFQHEENKSKGLCGSEPYIAPEQFGSKEYDGREVDIWACGIIYYAMMFVSLPWKRAVETDEKYLLYIKQRHNGYPPFKDLDKGCQTVLVGILEPEPKLRLTSEKIIQTEWMEKIIVCCTDDGESGIKHHHVCSITK